MATKYWNPSTGSNSNGGDSAGDAYLDFSKYINDGTAAAGDILILADGTYAGANYVITPTTSGTSGSKITVQAATPCTPLYTTPLTMRGNSKTASATIDGEDTRGCINMGTQNHWRFEGFRITQSSTHGVETSGRTGNEFYNLRIDNCLSKGMSGDSVIDAIVENCEIDTNADDGIKAASTSGDVRGLYRLLSIHHNVVNGLKLFPNNTGSERTVVELCHMDHQFGGGTHEDAMPMIEVHGVVIRSSIFSDFTQLFAIGGQTGDNKTVEDLWFYGNIMYNWKYYADSAGDLVGFKIEGANNRVDVADNINIFWNSCGFSGDTAGGPINCNDDGAMTTANATVRNMLYYDCRNNVGKAAQNFTAQWTVDGDYGIYYNLNDSGETNSKYSTDPLLLGYSGRDSTSFDFGLQDSSPAIGAGDPALTTAITGFGTDIPTGYTDMAGTVRTLNSGTMGALEYAAGERALFLVG